MLCRSLRLPVRCASTLPTPPPSPASAEPILPPLRAFVFIDGSWLYHSLNRALRRAHGEQWHRQRRLDLEQLVPTIASELGERLSRFGTRRTVAGSAACSASQFSGGVAAYRPLSSVAACSGAPAKAPSSDSAWTATSGPSGIISGG